METETEIGEEVVILKTAWQDDSDVYTGRVGVLLNFETECEFATVKTPEMSEESYVAVISYSRATPLIKALL
jgi:hypothetical protein